MGLLDKTSLTIYRIEKGSSYLNEEGQWVEGIDVEEIPIQCSLQPFNRGTNQLDLPEGVRASDSYYVYTQTPIRTKDDILGTEADETEIDGLRFECFSSENWSRYSLRGDHFKCTFIRKDKL